MALLSTVPALAVGDIAPAVDFYRDKLGFRVLYADDALAVLARDGVVLNLWAADDVRWRTNEQLHRRPVSSGAESFLAGTVSCRIRVDDVHALHPAMSGAGVLHPRNGGRIEDTDHATREFHVLDLDGNLLTFYQDV